MSILTCIVNKQSKESTLEERNRTEDIEFCYPGSNFLISGGTHNITQEVSLSTVSVKKYCSKTPVLC